MLGALVLCGIVFFIVIRSEGAASFPDEASDEVSGEKRITLTENGFVPKTLIVEEGDEVVFSSEVSRTFWPASDAHPSHSIYPEFDPTQPIEPGKEWSFVFNKIGVWRYHDHLYPRNKGTITVTK